MKLTLIRHGMTRGNMLRIYYGSTDLPILPESYAELEARAKTGFYPTAERYYTSGMLRAEQSFRAIYGDTPHSVLYGMREADFGDFEMRNYAELKDDPAYINNSGNIAQITYEQLAALCGDDVSTWGARMQCESDSAWEVYGVWVSTPVTSAE